MTQSIVIQVGQCGNQIGYRFWDLAYQERESNLSHNEESLNFFRLSKNKSNQDGVVKARALLIDMEESVVAEILKSHVQNLFDSKQLITDVSGSGNNWAVGHNIYGKMYASKIEDLLQREAEMCDNLQCFFLLHSMGGGTGSGLGTAILETLNDAFGKKHRFVTCVYPSHYDDVITSPYNAILANNQLTEYADCVVPVENEALADMCAYIQKNDNPFKSGFQKQNVISNGIIPPNTKEKPFDHMNNVIAHLLINITCSSRFPGDLNMDLNEIVINLMPYPRLHFLLSSITPLFPTQNLKTNQVVTDLFSSHNQLIKGEFRNEAFLSCAIIARGKLHFSDVQTSIDRIRTGLKLAPWGEDVWKIGICSVPPLNHSYSLSMLANNTSMWLPFFTMKERFLKMYVKKAHLHHFLNIDGITKETFDSSLENLCTLIEEYKALGSTEYHNIQLPRMQVLV